MELNEEMFVFCYEAVEHFRRQHSELHLATQWGIREGIFIVSMRYRDDPEAMWNGIMVPRVPDDCPRAYIAQELTAATLGHLQCGLDVLNGERGKGVLAPYRLDSIRQHEFPSN
jgi:hypothetical protein